MAGGRAAVVVPGQLYSADGPLLMYSGLAALAAGLAASRGLPAVWLTPVLTDGPTVAALRRPWPVPADWRDGRRDVGWPTGTVDHPARPGDRRR